MRAKRDIFLHEEGFQIPAPFQCPERIENTNIFLWILRKIQLDKCPLSYLSPAAVPDYQRPISLELASGPVWWVGRSPVPRRAGDSDRCYPS